MHTDMVDYFYQRRRFWYAEKLKIDDMYPARFLATDQNHVRGNSFFENQGGGKFAEVSDRIGAENYWPWGLSVGDLNADGWQDAFVASSMNYPFRYGVNSLLLNNRGKQFLDSEFILGVEPRKDRRTSTLWFELDCDGADRNHPLAEGRKGKVKVWAALGTRSSVLFDLDEDGDLDIVTNDFNSAPMVLVSDLAEKTDLHYLKIDLVGKKSSRQGLGAVVTVKAGGLQSVQANDGKSGYFGQSVAPLYFGLGEAAAADEIRVRWPTGKTQVVEGPVAANQKITITEEE
jgi:hypothetical protein